MKVYVLLEWSEWEGTEVPSIKGVFNSPEAAKAASGEEWLADAASAEHTLSDRFNRPTWSIEEHTLLD